MKPEFLYSCPSAQVGMGSHTMRVLHRWSLNMLFVFLYVLWLADAFCCRSAEVLSFFASCVCLCSGYSFEHFSLLCGWCAGVTKLVAIVHTEIPKGRRAANTRIWLARAIRCMALLSLVRVLCRLQHNSERIKQMDHCRMAREKVPDSGNAKRSCRC